MRPWWTIATCGGLALLLWSLSLSFAPQAAARRLPPRPPLPTTSVVASDHPVASQIGAQAMENGGNAIDAAAATVLALGTVNPVSSGIGGGAFALVYIAAEGRTYAIDFREIGPAAVRQALFLRDGEPVAARSRIGGLAVGTPGEVAGLHHLVKRFGRLSWRRAVAPAQDLARHGFALSEFFLHATSMTKGLIADDSRLGQWLAPVVGGAADTLARPVFADTLSVIGQRGQSGFYRGAVAQDIAASVQAAGGVMTTEDLANYQVRERTPLRMRWRGYELVTMPLPSSGGIAFVEALGILEYVNFADIPRDSADYYHVVAEALKHAFADRARFLGDASAARQQMDALLRPERLKRLAARIKKARVGRHEQYGGRERKLSAPPKADSGTSHLCAIDRRGNAVALTTTVNGFYGAKVMTTKTGIVMNNEIDDFSMKAGVANQFGLVQSERNLVRPGKRPLSSMSPTLVMRRGRVVGCVGGSGGPTIISNSLQVLLNAFVHNMPAQKAVSAPRIHHQWLPR